MSSDPWQRGRCLLSWYWSSSWQVLMNFQKTNIRIFSAQILCLKTILRFNSNDNLCISIFYHFWPFFHQLNVHLLQNWGSDGHFEVLNGSKSWIFKILQLFFFWGIKTPFGTLFRPKWPFYNHLWSLFANYIDIFHKTEIQAVILRYVGCLNLNWIKSCDILLAKVFSCHHWKCIFWG